MDQMHAAQSAARGHRHVEGGDRRAAPADGAGRPRRQIQSFELKLVDRLWESATPENAREIADRTWDLVHDRADGDPVKRRVVECHEALARMTRLGD